MILDGVQLFLANYCARNQAGYFRILTKFRLSLEKQGVATVSDIRTVHITQFAAELNAETRRRSTKRHQFGIIRQYLEFLSENELIEKEVKIPRHGVKWTDFIQPAAAARAVLAVPTVEEAKVLIQHAAKVGNRRMYVYLGLLAPNGMRDSELRSLYINNINLETRFVVTGVVEDHAKEGEAVYFVPKPLIRELGLYMEKLRRHNYEFLFPGETDTGFTDRVPFGRTVRKYAKLEGLTCKVNAHAFRHAINYERLKMGCNEALMAILLNQTPQGSNAQFYLKMVRDHPEIRRDFWDQFTPNYF